MNDKGHKIIGIDFSEDKSTFEGYLGELGLLGIDEGSIGGIINCCGKSHVTRFNDISES